MEAPPKVRVSKLKGFNDNQNAKELENFPWDKEQYFKVAWIPKTEMVTIGSMYLTSDAKLQWQTKIEDNAKLGRPHIASWETLKNELKD